MSCTSTSARERIAPGIITAVSGVSAVPFPEKSIERESAVTTLVALATRTDRSIVFPPEIEILVGATIARVCVSVLSRREDKSIENVLPSFIVAVYVQGVTEATIETIYFSAADTSAFNSFSASCTLVEPRVPA